MYLLKQFHSHYTCMYPGDFHRIIINTFWVYSFMFPVTKNANTVIYCKISWIRNVWNWISGDINFFYMFFMFIELLSWVWSEFSNKIGMGKLLDIGWMSFSTPSTREPFLSTIIGISSLMFTLFNALTNYLNFFH